MDDTTRYARGYARGPHRTERRRDEGSRDEGRRAERRRHDREERTTQSAQTAGTTRESPPLVTRWESDDGDVRIDLRDDSDVLEITVHLPDEEWDADVSMSASTVHIRAEPADGSSAERSDAVERRVALTRSVAMERAMMVRSDATLIVTLPTAIPA